jgi:hypothetical protein
MWWYGYGWWMWWLAFVILFFLLPLGYGWGYRGWGPWYRRRNLVGEGRPVASTERPVSEYSTGDWGAFGIVLWIVLLVALVWLFAALVWGGRY